MRHIIPKSETTLKEKQILEEKLNTYQTILTMNKYHDDINEELEKLKTTITNLEKEITKTS